MGAWHSVLGVCETPIMSVAGDIGPVRHQVGLTYEVPAAIILDGDLKWDGWPAREDAVISADDPAEDFRQQLQESLAENRVAFEKDLKDVVMPPLGECT